MKTVICQLLLLVIVAFNYNAEATTAADAEAMSKKFNEECIKEGSLSAEERTRIMANEIFSPKYKNASEKLQCFLLCYYKKIGIIDADGKQKPEISMEYLLHRFADKKEKIIPALQKCDDIKLANPCQVIYQFEKCVLQEMTA